MSQLQVQLRRVWWVDVCNFQVGVAHFSYQVFFDPAPIGVSYAEIVERADALPNPISLGGSRLVVHIQTSQETVDDFVSLVRTMAEEKKAAGFVYNRQANGNTNGNIYVRALKKQVATACTNQSAKL